MRSKANEILKHLLEDGFDHDATIKEVDVLRKNYQQQNDVDNANVAWAIQLLRDGEYYKVWCLLEHIEIGIGTLLRNFPGTKNAVSYIDTIVKQLQSLYPYKLFCSTVVLVKKRTCSICGKERVLRHHCGHYAGHVYCGELCHDIVESAELEGVDIVTNPQHKYAVAFLTNESGERIDHYNYMLLASLMQDWDNPYKPWHYVVNPIHKSPEEFPDLTDDSTCPCGSGKVYSECCKNDPEGIKFLEYEYRWGLKEPIKAC